MRLLQLVLYFELRSFDRTAFNMDAENLLKVRLQVGLNGDAGEKYVDVPIDEAGALDPVEGLAADLERD